MNLIVQNLLILCGIKSKMINLKKVMENKFYGLKFTMQRIFKYNLEHSNDFDLDILIL